MTAKIITMQQVRQQAGLTEDKIVQRPDEWDWSPHNLTDIELVTAYEKVAENGGSVFLVRVDGVGAPDFENPKKVSRRAFAGSFMHLHDERYVSRLGTSFKAVVANQDMIIDGEGFNFAISEGSAIVSGLSGHGGSYKVYTPHQFIPLA